MSLYPEGIHERDLALPPIRRRFTWRNFFLWLGPPAQVCRSGSPSTGIHPFRRRALKKAEQWMLERFEGSDGLAAIFPAMLNSLIALKALGYPDDHPQVRASGTRVEEAASTKPPTAFASSPASRRCGTRPSSAICLRESGVPADHPQLQRAGRMVDEQGNPFRGRLAVTRTRPRSSPAAGCLNSKTSGIRTWTTRPWCCWPCARCPPTIRSSATNAFSAG